MTRHIRTYLYTFFACCCLIIPEARGQQAAVNARADAAQITVGDQVKFFIEATHRPAQSRLQWTVIPDTFNSLEVVEKGKIDTTRQGDLVTYKQRLLITGFDSGSFKIPAFSFAVIPASGAPYTIQTDSFQLLVQTVPVDTTKPFKGIKEIIQVNASWKDYIWLIIGGLVLLILATVVVVYFRKHRKVAMPAAVPKAPPETAGDRALRLLEALEAQQLWQSDRVKEYYVRLSEILRSYIEEHFHAPAMELTTGELLAQAGRHPEMRQYYEQLALTLHTADLAKFAKARPLPHEHTNAIEQTRQFILNTKPVLTTAENTPK